MNLLILQGFTISESMEFKHFSRSIHHKTTRTMSNYSKIEWTDRTWNPVTGCTKVSQGCKNCYAERITNRFKRENFTDVTLHPERLYMPVSWKKPSMVFVNSMSDLFHDEVPFSFIKTVFSMMGNSPIHTFQVLTKRPERAIEFFKYYETELQKKDKPGYNLLRYINSPNIWIGVSVEDQQTAKERIPLLLQIPASVRFISCEPLLGRIDINLVKTGIDWVIVGGESGPNARPMHPDWAYSLQKECSRANVPFFFKQWGEWIDINDGYEYINFGPRKKIERVQLGSHYWNAVDMFKVGKKAAGNLLNGKAYQEFPDQFTKKQPEQ